MTIDEATADTSVTGVELIPVSDGGAAKSVTVTALKQFVIDQIEAIAAGTSVATGNGLFALQSGVLKPVDIDLVCQRAIDTLWSKTLDASPAGTDKIAIKDGSTTENTVTLAVLAEYVRKTIEAAVLDVSDLSDGSGAIATTDYMLVTQGTTGKRIQISDLVTLVYSTLADYVAALTAITTPADADVFYAIQGGNQRKVTLATLKTALGSTVAPATTTENYVPQWSSAQKTLKDGLAVRSAVRATGTADNSSLATEAAVRALVEDPTNSLGSESGTVAMRLGASSTEGLETVVVDVDVTLGAVEGVAVLTIPAGALLRCVQANVSVAAVAGGTSVKIGIGTTEDPNSIGATSALTLNTKFNYLPVPTLVASEMALKVFPCASDGSIGDTAFTAGSVRVRIIFDRLTSLNDE